MEVIQANSINDGLAKVLEGIVGRGNKVDIKGKETLELHPCLIEFDKPLKRTLLYPGRGNNPFASLAETLWILAGRNDVDWLKFFLPRAPDWSDDGEVWRAGYGPRLRQWKAEGECSSEWTFIDQIKYVYDTLKNDLMSRQAIISLWDPGEECTVGKTLDCPCSNWLHFMVRRKYRPELADIKDKPETWTFHLDCEFVIRSNDAIWGFCLSGATKIKLLDGTVKPIKDLVDKQFWVYSKNNDKEIVPGKVIKCKKTGKKKILKITFSDGSFVRCSKNHKFLLRDWKYRKAKNLKVGDSIDSVYFRLNKKGYEQYNNGDGWFNTHIMANILSEKGELDSNNNFHITHHKDFVKRNNNPENLLWLGNYDHHSFHAELLRKMWRDPKYRKSRKKVIKKLLAFNRKQWKNPEYRRERRKILSERMIQWWEEERFDTELHKEAAKNNLINYNKSFKGRNKSREIGQTFGTDNFKKYHKTGGHLKTLAKIHREKLNNTPKIKFKRTRTRILNVFNELKKRFLEFNEENYFNYKPMGNPGWKKVFEYFKDLDEINECLENYNHIVTSIKSDGYEDTYDLEVEDYHNFVLENGVIVHNSNINFYEWSVLQEILASVLGIEIGTFYYYVSSIHVYKHHWKRVKKLLENKEKFVDNLPEFRFCRGQINLDKYLEDCEMLCKYVEEIIINDKKKLKYFIPFHGERGSTLNDIACLLSVFVKMKQNDNAWRKTLHCIPFSDLKVSCYYYAMKNIFKYKDYTIQEAIEKVQKNEY